MSVTAPVSNVQLDFQCDFEDADGFCAACRCQHSVCIAEARPHPSTNDSCVSVILCKLNSKPSAVRTLQSAKSRVRSSIMRLCSLIPAMRSSADFRSASRIFCPMLHTCLPIMLHTALPASEIVKKSGEHYRERDCWRFSVSGSHMSFAHAPRAFWE